MIDIACKKWFYQFSLRIPSSILECILLIELSLRDNCVFFERS